MNHNQTLADSIVQYSQQMIRDGLTHGTSGNISARLDDDTIAITPSGVSYDRLAASDICMIDVVSGARMAGPTPSTETPMHLTVFRERGDVGAVVHTHSLYATACAVSGREVPALHYEIAPIGNTIPVIPYATYGTDELANHVSAAIRQYGPSQNGFLLKNHGVLAFGKTLSMAYSNAKTIEYLAQLLLLSSTLLGPVVLSSEELERVRSKFLGYGQSDA